MRKTAILIFTLAIPASIFLFLKIFGTNSFEVPVLYEKGIPGCPGSDRPFTVPDLDFINESGQTKVPEGSYTFKVFAVIDPQHPMQFEERLAELVRIQDAFFETGSPTIVLLNIDNDSALSEISRICEDKGLKSENFVFIKPQEEELEDFLACGLGLKDGNELILDKIVLSDPEGRIRGQYRVFETEETDKLILELKILKDKAS